MFASKGQERRIKFQLQEKTNEELVKLKKSKPNLKEIIYEILEERKGNDKN